MNSKYTVFLQKITQLPFQKISIKNQIVFFVDFEIFWSDIQFFASAWSFHDENDLVLTKILI